jgi:transposase
MPRIIRLDLSAPQKAELQHIRDHASKPYLRERAAALLKVASGQTITEVAAEGLLKPRKHETVRAWLTRYQQQGLDGLGIHSGRGRKSAFSPSQDQ